MSVAAYAARKRIQNLRENATVRSNIVLLDQCLVILDEEIEREAEREFTRPMNPDPVTVFTKA